MLNEVFANITSCNTASKLDAALIYARIAPVFPLRPNTKLPLLKGSWVEYATQDENLIRTWWTQYPEANIAMVTGNQLMCSDLDMKDGENGWNSYQHLAPGDVSTPIQTTPSGGFHLIHSFEPELINFTKRGEYGGIDLRTTNGYIVVAPSYVVDDDPKKTGGYQWLQGGDVVPAPQSILGTYHQWSTESAVDRDVELPELLDITNLKPLEEVPIRQKFLDFLQTGEVHQDYQGDRSRALMGATAALYQTGLTDSEVMTYLENSPGAINCAQDHSTDRRANLWLWKYNCVKVRENITTRQQSTQASIDEAFANVEVTPQAPGTELTTTPEPPKMSEKERFKKMAWDVDPNDDDEVVRIYSEAYKINPIFADQIANVLSQVSGAKKTDLEKYRKLVSKQQLKDIRKGDVLQGRQTGDPLPINHPANNKPSKELTTWQDVIGRYVYISSENHWPRS